MPRSQNTAAPIRIAAALGFLLAGAGSAQECEPSGPILSPLRVEMHDLQALDTRLHDFDGDGDAEWLEGDDLTPGTGGPLISRIIFDWTQSCAVVDGTTVCWSCSFVNGMTVCWASH